MVDVGSGSLHRDRILDWLTHASGWSSTGDSLVRATMNVETTAEKVSESLRYVTRWMLGLAPTRENMRDLLGKLGVFLIDLSVDPVDGPLKPLVPDLV